MKVAEYIFIADFLFSFFHLINNFVYSLISNSNTNGFEEYDWHKMIVWWINIVESNFIMSSEEDIQHYAV